MIFILVVLGLYCFICCLLYSWDKDSKNLPDYMRMWAERQEGKLKKERGYGYEGKGLKKTTGRL